MTTAEIKIKESPRRSGIRIFIPLNVVRDRKTDQLILISKVYTDRFVGNIISEPHKGVPVDGINDPNLYEQFVGTIELTYP